MPRIVVLAGNRPVAGGGCPQAGKLDSLDRPKEAETALLDEPNRLILGPEPKSRLQAIGGDAKGLKSLGAQHGRNSTCVRISQPRVRLWYDSSFLGGHLHDLLPGPPSHPPGRSGGRARRPRADAARRPLFRRTRERSPLGLHPPHAAGPSIVRRIAGRTAPGRRWAALSAAGSHPRDAGLGGRRAVPVRPAGWTGRGGGP